MDTVKILRTNFVKYLTLISGLFVLLLSLQVKAEPFSHQAWDALLQKHVRVVNEGLSTRADYAGFKQDKVQLDAYLKSLSSVPKATFSSWSKPEQLAFLINAYNAFTVDLILTKYPDLKSIKELGSWLQSPWKKEFFTLLGQKASLDWVEHTLIRGGDVYQEPRIHFAVNCASLGCPPLLESAFTAERLEAQLEAQTLRFLKDRQQNRLEGKKLAVSSIFKWYEEDFEKAWGGYNALSEFLVQYAQALALSPDASKALSRGELRITFLDYDWGLNDVER